MKGYWLILGSDVKDGAAQEQYAALWMPVAARFGATVRVLDASVLREAHTTRRVVVVEFPSVELARACYADPARCGQERRRSAPGLGLGRSERAAAAARVADLPGYPHGAGVDVDVSRTERGKFGPTKAGEGGHEHERPIARRDGIGHGVDLGNVQKRTFG